MVGLVVLDLPEPPGAVAVLEVLEVQHGGKGPWLSGLFMELGGIWAGGDI